MLNPGPKKKLRYKLVIDPLPFLEYFVPEEGIELAKLLVPHGEMKAALDHHTVNRDYAKSIATKFGYPDYVPRHPDLCIDEVNDILSQPMSEICSDYLKARSFPMDLIHEYQMSSWRYRDHDYKSLSRYFPFYKEELEYASYKLEQLGEPTDMLVQEQIVMPSYDRQGNLNNLVFRYVDEHVSKFWAKWLFSHGRSATFGLHKIDPNKTVYVVEGFFDHVACDQLGMQSVGLGSAFISDMHWKQLEGLKLVFILDSDEVGAEYSNRLKADGHRVWMLKDKFKDPYEYWINKKELEFT